MGSYSLVDTSKHVDLLTIFRFEIEAFDDSDNRIDYLENYVTKIYCGRSALTISLAVEAANNSIKNVIELASKVHKITVLNKNEQDDVVSSVSYIIVGNCGWDYTLSSDSNEVLSLAVTYSVTPHFNKV